MLPIVLLASAAVAGIPWEGDESEALAFSVLSIKGEVIASKCESTAIIDEQGSYHETFHATIEIDEVLASVEGFSEDSITLVSRTNTWLGDTASGCEFNDGAHPIGERGTYYLESLSSDDGEPLYQLYLGSGFVESEDSAPLAAPECPSLEEADAEAEVEPIEDGAKLGCSTTSASGGSLSGLLVLGLLLGRRSSVR